MWQEINRSNMGKHEKGQRVEATEVNIFNETIENNTHIKSEIYQSINTHPVF